MKTAIVIFLGFLGFLSSLSAEQMETKYAVITGASRGIGRALVEVLLERDNELRIFAVARGEKDLEEIADAHLGQVIPIVADISTAEGLEEVKKTVRATLLDGGSLSYLVHNAAILAPLGDLDYLHQQPLPEVLSMMDTSYRINVIAPHLLTVSLLPELRRAGDAKILFVSSRAADLALPGMVTYSCTKAALDHMVKNLRASFKKEVSIGMLHPGEIDTDMQTNLRRVPETQLAISAQFKKAEKNGRLISSKTSAKFIAYLLCDTSFEEFSEKKWDIYFVRPSNFPQELSDEIGMPPAT